MRIFLCIMALLVRRRSGALAQSACSEPPTPPPVDGANASADQLRAAVAAGCRLHRAIRMFHQNCLVGELDAARTQAGAHRRSST